MEITTFDFMLRVTLAIVLGLIVGLDRQIKRKPLGAQAYMLIAGGSAAFMVMCVDFGNSAIAETGGISVDPTRAVQGILGGIGFLGAGAIISQNENGRLRGVASGAAIWTVGAVGVACGLGYLLEAAYLAGLTYLVLAGFEWLRDKGALPDEYDEPR